MPLSLGTRRFANCCRIPVLKSEKRGVGIPADSSKHVVLTNRRPKGHARSGRPEKKLSVSTWFPSVRKKKRTSASTATAVWSASRGLTHSSRCRAISEFPAPSPKKIPEISSFPIFKRPIPELASKLLLLGTVGGPLAAAAEHRVGQTCWAGCPNGFAECIRTVLLENLIWRFLLRYKTRRSATYLG